MGLKTKAPKDLNGDQLIEELVAEGYVPRENPWENLALEPDGDLVVNLTTESGADLDEGSRAKVERIVKAHKPKKLRDRDPGDAEVKRLEQLDKKQGKLSADEIEEAVRLLLKGKRPRREA